MRAIKNVPNRPIHHLHKLLDKSSGGYVNGQTVVLLLLMTQKITIPVGFAFYMPDPALTAWAKEDKKLKKAGIAKKNRPKQPEINPNYPTKQVIALSLLKQFQDYHPKFKVKVIVADALYGSKDFMDKASAQFKDIQVISQLRSNQNVFFQGHKIDVTKYFAKPPGTPQKVRCRLRSIHNCHRKSCETLRKGTW